MSAQDHARADLERVRNEYDTQPPEFWVGYLQETLAHLIRENLIKETEA